MSDRIADLPALLSGPSGTVVLRAVLLGSLAACVLLGIPWRRRAGSAAGVLAGGGLGPAAAVAILLILGYQATWQLTGFARPRFMHFMRTYDRRPWRAADGFRRGSLVDGRGLRLAVDDRGVPGRRCYPLGEAGAHILGYRHGRYGLSGLEHTLDPVLSGVLPLSSRDLGSLPQGLLRQDETAKAAWEETLVRLRRFSRSALDHGDAGGADVHLTLDGRLQKVAQSLLAGRPGACVALRPRDGAILVLVSSPSFDPEDLDMESLRLRPDAPLFNRALRGLYPPGSAFKVLVAAAALDAGLEPVWDCPAEGFRPGPGQPPICDHESYEYARRGRVWPGRQGVDIEAALTHSSNAYFARLGVALGHQAFNRVTAAALFNQSLPLAEAPGSPAAAASQAPRILEGEAGELAQCSIGQGRMLATPLQMALIAAAVGADGLLWQPRLLSAEPPRCAGRVMSPATARRLRGAMRRVVREGTARRADVPGLEVAGKTGTAQGAVAGDHAWFIALAPAAAPEVALAVVIEHGGYGSRSAVPVGADLLGAARTLGILGGTAGGEGP
ncbi:MAG: penicillin-binding protein 2 [Lentisphaeria bacterium]|nr:penicillin-binding protein 2 [Lentisphaeria bacterium]